MAEQDQDQDKSEEATPFKRQEAKRRGQVSKSMDVNSLFLIGSVLTLVYLWGMSFIAGGLRLERAILSQAGLISFEPAEFMAWTGAVAQELLMLIAPLFITVAIVAVLSNMIQTGPVFSGFPLKPDIQRLNPARGFKRVFSLRMLFEALKSVIKLALFSAVAYFVITGLMPQLLDLLQIDPRAYPPLLMAQASELAFKLFLILLIIALLDLAYTRREYSKKMRMSRRELKDEVKRREGDPQVRAKIRELQREARKRSESVKRVPEADVLITNPAHLAIALRYDRGKQRAPQLLAKGADKVAAKMREAARRHHIPIIEQKPLARQLFQEVDIDAPIPETLYEPVARVYAEVYGRQSAGMRVEIHT